MNNFRNKNFINHLKSLSNKMQNAHFDNYERSKNIENNSSNKLLKSNKSKSPSSIIIKQNTNSNTNININSNYLVKSSNNVLSNFDNFDLEDNYCCKKNNNELNSINTNNFLNNCYSINARNPNQRNGSTSKIRYYKKLRLPTGENEENNVNANNKLQMNKVKRSYNTLLYNEDYNKIVKNNNNKDNILFHLISEENNNIQKSNHLLTKSNLDLVSRMRDLNQETDQTKQQLNELLDKNDKLIKEVDLLNKEKINLIKFSEDFKNQNDNLLKEIETLENKIQEYDSILATKDNYNKELKNSILKLKENSNSSFLNMSNELNKTKCTNDNLEKQLKYTNDLNTKLQNKIIEYEKTNNKLSKEIEMLNDDNLNIKFVKYKNIINENNDLIQKKNYLINQLNDRINILNNNLNKTKSDLNTSKNSYNNIANDYSNKGKQINNLIQQIDNLYSTITDKDSIIQNLSHINHNLYIILCNIQNKKNDIFIELNKYSNLKDNVNNNNNTNEIYNLFTRYLNDIDTILNNIKFDKFKDILSNLNISINKNKSQEIKLILEEGNSISADDDDDLLSKFTDKQKENFILNQKINELTGLNSNLNKDYSMLKKEYEDLKNNKIANLENENKILQNNIRNITNINASEVNNYIKQISELNLNITNLKKLNEKLKQENDKLNAQNDYKTKELLEIKNNFNEIAQNHEFIKKRNNNLEKENQMLNNKVINLNNMNSISNESIIKTKSQLNNLIKQNDKLNCINNHLKEEFNLANTKFNNLLNQNIDKIKFSQRNKSNNNSLLNNDTNFFLFRIYDDNRIIRFDLFTKEYQIIEYNEDKIDKDNLSFGKNYNSKGSLFIDTFYGIFILTGHNYDLLYYYNNLDKKIKYITQFKYNHSYGGLVIDTDNHSIYALSGLYNKKVEKYINSKLINEEPNICEISNQEMTNLVELNEMTIERSETSFLFMNHIIYSFFGYCCPKSSYINTIEYFENDVWNLLNFTCSSENINNILIKDSAIVPINNNEIFILGGYNGFKQCSIEDIYCFDFTKNNLEIVDKKLPIIKNKNYINFNKESQFISFGDDEGKIYMCGIDDKDNVHIIEIISLRYDLYKFD